MKKLLSIGLLCTSGLFLSCDVQEQQEPKLLPEFVSAKAAVFSDPSGKTSIQYLTIELSPDGAISDLLYVSGHQLLDDGLGYDRVKGDNIYSSVEAIVYDDGTSNGRVSQTETEIGCDFDVVGVGSTCGDGNVCPEESMSGGSTWFCVCFYNCYFIWG